MKTEQMIQLGYKDIDLQRGDFDLSEFKEKFSDVVVPGSTSGNKSIEETDFSIDQTMKQLGDLLNNNPDFKHRWEGGNVGLKDTSGSGFEMSVINFLSFNHFSFSQTNYLLWNVFEHGKAEHNIDTFKTTWKKAPAPRLAYTDIGNCERFVRDHKDRVRWNIDRKKWMIYKNGQWEPTVEGVTTPAIRTAKNLKNEKPDSKELRAHIKNSQQLNSIQSMLKLAKDKLQVKASVFDSNLMLLNCENGTLNLVTGELQPHNKEEFISKSTGVCFDPQAASPIWESFINDITCGDEELAGFLQRAIGYCMTGLTTEQVIFFLLGAGNNGKSTFVETAHYILGDYGKHTSGDSVLLRKSGGKATDLAALPGVRFATCAEVGQGQKLNESQVKSMSGGDKIIAKAMAENEYSFDPQFKLLMALNDVPEITGTDEGIWRRIRLIDFKFVATDPDKHLRSKLEGEAPGILNWLLKGCLEWQANGLMEPESVLKSTKEFRLESDSIQLFIDTHMVKGNEKDTSFRIDPDELYKVYCKFEKERNRIHVSPSKFKKDMKLHNHEPKTCNVNGKSVRMYKGLKVKLKSSSEILESAIDDFNPMNIFSRNQN